MTFNQCPRILIHMYLQFRAINIRIENENSDKNK